MRHVPWNTMTHHDHQQTLSDIMKRQRLWDIRYNKRDLKHIEAWEDTKCTVRQRERYAIGHHKTSWDASLVWWCLETKGSRMALWMIVYFFLLHCMCVPQVNQHTLILNVVNQFLNLDCKYSTDIYTLAWILHNWSQFWFHTLYFSV